MNKFLSQISYFRPALNLSFSLFETKNKFFLIIVNHQ